MIMMMMMTTMTATNVQLSLSLPCSAPTASLPRCFLPLDNEKASEDSADASIFQEPPLISTKDSPQRVHDPQHSISPTESRPPL